MSFFELMPWVEHATTAIIDHPHENCYMQRTVNDRQQKLVITTVEALQKCFSVRISSCVMPRLANATVPPSAGFFWQRGKAAAANQQ